MTTIENRPQYSQENRQESRNISNNEQVNCLQKSRYINNNHSIGRCETMLEAKKKIEEKHNNG